MKSLDSSPPSSEITQFLLIVASERTATNEPSKQSWVCHFVASQEYILMAFFAAASTRAKP